LHGAEKTLIVLFGWPISDRIIHGYLKIKRRPFSEVGKNQTSETAIPLGEDPPADQFSPSECDMPERGASPESVSVSGIAWHHIERAVCAINRCGIREILIAEIRAV